MGVNKIALPNEVLIDLTGDTVDADSLLAGRKAHNAAGDQITGTMPDNAASTVTLDVYNTSHTIRAGRHSGSGKVQIVPQTKTVKPDTYEQTVTPDSGKVLSAVAVDAIQTEENTFTPTAAGTIIMPSSGKYLSKVTVNPVPTMTKTVTPTESAQTYYPDAGKFFSAFTVEAAAAGGMKVYTGQFYTNDAYEINIDAGVTIKDFAILVISTGYWTTMGTTDVEVIVKMSGQAGGFRMTSGVDMGLPDYPLYVSSDIYSLSLFFTESGFSVYNNGNLTGLAQYTWYLIQ